MVATIQLEILKFDFDHSYIFIGKDWLGSLFMDTLLHFYL